MSHTSTESQLLHGGRTLLPEPLAGMDFNSGYLPVRRVFFYAGQPDIARLQASLQQALAQWPDFSGRIREHEGLLCIDRNDGGARFTLEQRNEPISPFGIKHPLGLPAIQCDEAISQQAGDNGPAFTVKVTAYNDGHWTLGTCNSHALCDGTGYWQFMQSWRAAFHGATLAQIESDFPRYHGGITTDTAVPLPDQLQQPPEPLLPQQMENFKIYRSAQILLPQTQLTALKQSINAQLAPQWIGTQDLVMALVWQTLAQQALHGGLAPDTPFPLGNVLNVRKHLQLEHYVGNLACSVASQDRAQHIATATLATLAARLRADSQQLDAGTARANLDFMQRELLHGHVNRMGYFTQFSSRIAAACVHGRGVMINNWSSFPAYATDFGGIPLWFDLATVIPMHFAMVMPAPAGVVLRLFLPETSLHTALQTIQQRVAHATGEPT